MGEINDDWRNELDISGLNLMDEDDSLLLFSSDGDKEDRGGLDLFGDIQKYNLRKSLAWDKAFFTNAGVLEPDELSNMIESNHVGEKSVLATIQENVKRSTESISTLKSDCTTETSQDYVLFEDVRASTQRSDGVTPDKSEAAVDMFVSQMKPNAIRKRPSIRAQGLGKVTKQLVAAKEHNTSISRPSTGLSKSVRASADVNKTKLTGESPLASSRRIQPIVATSKSSLRSSLASKNELTSSCSSLESCISASSSASKKSVKQKNAQSLRIASHSLVNASTSRAASKLISQCRVSPLSSSSTYKSRLSSNASLLSASVDCSFNSPRASSTPNIIAKGKKKTVAGGSSPAVNNGGTVSSASMTKPTGLRVPSPKLGYFDGTRSSVARTLTGSSKHGGRSLNESTTCSRIKSGKSQPIGSRLTQAKARPVSRSSRLIVSASSAASSPKLTNKTYSKVSAEEQLNGNLAQ